MKQLLLTLGTLGLLFVISCGGDDDDKKTTAPDIAGKTKRQIFQMQPWKFVDWSDSAEGGADVWESQADACWLNDVWTFVSNTSISINDAGTRCNPPYVSDIWSMPSDNATTVNIFDQEWDIVSMTNNEIYLWKAYNSGQSNRFRRLILRK